MRIRTQALSAAAAALATISSASAFLSPSASSSRRSSCVVSLTSEPTEPHTSTPVADKSENKRPRQKATLGLLTFDLDDTLYPVSPVFTDANIAFANAMHSFGFDGIQPNDIAETGRAVREEMAAENPEMAAALSFTETRMKAIRRQMEGVRLLRSLEDVAKEWATPVSGLSPVVSLRCLDFLMELSWL